MEIRKLLIRIGFSLLVLIFLAVCVEVGFRFTKPGNRVIFDDLPGVGLVRAPNQHGYDRGNEQPGEWVPMSINKIGLRGPDVPEIKNPDETRILCIGDSFVFGGGLGDEDTFPAIAQKLCGAPPEKIRWMNGGGVGHDGRESAACLELYQPQVKPDIVVFGWNWNDLVSILNENSSKYAGSINDPTITSIASFLGISPYTIRSLAFIKYFGWKRNHAPWVLKTPAEIREYREGVIRAAQGEDSVQRWDGCRRALLRMLDHCTRNNIKLIIFVMPELTWRDKPEFVAMPKLRELLTRMRIPYFDGQPEYYERVRRGEHMVQDYDPFHPSAQGQAMFAEIVLKALRAQGWIPPGN